MQSIEAGNFILLQGSPLRDHEVIHDRQPMRSIGQDFIFCKDPPFRDHEEIPERNNPCAYFDSAQYDSHYQIPIPLRDHAIIPFSPQEKILRLTVGF